MQDIIIVSLELATEGKTLSGQGVVVFSLIRALKSMRVKCLCLGFGGQESSEYIDGAEIVRIFTPLSRKYNSLQKLLLISPQAIDRLCFEFKDGVLKYLLFHKSEFRNPIIHIHHGWGEGLIVTHLKKNGFAKIMITFHMFKIQRYLRSAFRDGYIDLKYDYNSAAIWQRLLLKSKILNMIWKDEVELIKFIYILYKLKLNFLLPHKIKIYYEGEIISSCHADSVSVLSEDMLYYLSLICPYDISKKIKVVRNGIDASFFKQRDNIIINDLRRKFGVKDDDTVLLFIGRIEPVKGVQYIIESMKEIEDKIEQRSEKIKLLIAGDCYGVYQKSYLPHLVRLANRLEKIKVFFVGPIYNADKIALFDLSTVLLSPSFYDQFGLVSLEGMARGKPIIFINFYGSIKTVTKRDFLIIANCNVPFIRAKKLSESIIKILEMDFPLMGAAAKGEAKKHTWDYASREYLGIYDSL